MVEAVAEQKQVFAGAAHPFYWKPKLRIPDIQMREGMLHLVSSAQGRLSKDLGDVAGLCFEVGTGRLLVNTLETISLIDVLWLDRASGEIRAGFEVERSTSIYSGILRLFDLALSVPACQNHLYLVAPDNREREILAQLMRPSVLSTPVPKPAYILFEELACNCGHMARFGTGLDTLRRICKSVGA